MSVLFVMPNWNSPSELWLHRMIDMMEDEIDTIACYNPQTSYYNSKIPVLNLLDQSLITRARNKFKLLPKACHFNYKEIEGLIRKNKIKSLFIHYLTTLLNLKSIIERVEVPVYVHCHGYDVMWDLKRLEGFKDSLHPVHPENYIDEVLSLSERVKFIANSNYTAGRLKEINIHDENIIVKSYGVSASPQPIVRTNRGRIKILYLGRLVDFKGPDLVIRAFDLARSRGLDAELIMAGDGYLMFVCNVLKQRSKFCDDIHLLGVTDANAGEKLRLEADIFTAHNCKGIFSNQEEALGVSVLEAMSASLPVISGKNGALTETVVNGETGILVEPGNVEEHAEAFLKLAQDQAMRNEMGRKGWERVKNHFSYDQEKQRLKEIFQF